MKTRKGFVSNSSTCSFMLAGFDITNTELESNEVVARKLLTPQQIEIEISAQKVSEFYDGEVNWWGMIAKHMVRNKYVTILDHPEDGAPPGKKFIGFRIADISLGGYDETKVIDITDIQLQINALASALGLSPFEWKIVTGVRMC